MKDFSPAFAERLKRLRGRTPAATFARSVGCANPSTYFYWEKGRLPHSSVVNQIADCCHVTVDWLLGRSDTGGPPETTREPSAAYCVNRPQPMLCNYPVDAHLPERLQDLESRLGRIETLLVALLAEERSKPHPADPTVAAKVG